MQGTSEKARRIRGIERGRGLAYLMAEACKIFGHPMLIHDMEYKAIEVSKNVVTDDPIWNEYATKGTASPEWLDFFKTEFFIEAAANAKTITFLTSDKLNYNRIFGKLFNRNNIQIGCAVMIATEKPFEDEDPVLFEELCQMFTEEISRDAFYDTYGQAYFEKLVDELIAGVSDLAFYAAHVESIYMHLKANLYLAVVDIGACDPGYTQLEHYRDLLKKAQPEYAYAIYLNYILIIIGTDNSTLRPEKDLAALGGLFYEKRIYAGISSTFENLFELGTYYRQAQSALEGGRGDGAGHIFLYEPPERVRG